MAPRWRSRARVEQLSNLPGEVAVRFTVDMNGELTELRIVKSSLKDSVEEAIALRAFRDNAPFAPLPEDFGLLKLSFTFVFIYR